ncbi:MAG: hypothetical protein IJI43_02390 [Bacilli bacterium]|nr:hypothetical protein [Bacilli bacterium]MBQ6539043.1 hypothetical protein [Bacilli bacterium]
MINHKLNNNPKCFITIFIIGLFIITTLISVGFSALNKDINISGDIDYIRDGEPLYDVLKNATEEGIYAKEYTGNHQDSMMGVGTEKIYHWWAEDDNNGTAILDKWNVIFGEFCWQIIRTTDTGGVKLLYNGVPSDGQCNNSGSATKIGNSLFAIGGGYAPFASVGYMYNPSSLLKNNGNSAATSGSLFGKGVTYSGATYTLTNTSTTYDENHHYTCNNATGTCDTVRYYYYDNYYTEISDGRTIEEHVEDMFSVYNVNQTNSYIKTYVDNWYQSNMTSYTNKLEDTIFCNDRSIDNLGGFNPNGGLTNGRLQFKNYGYTNSDLTCTNITDKFCVSNTKAKLTYPVGLLTFPEVYILTNNVSSSTLRNSGSDYILATPSYIRGRDVYIRFVAADGHVQGYAAEISQGVRPVISLKFGTKYISGSGSKSDPYIVQ